MLLLFVSIESITKSVMLPCIVPFKGCFASGDGYIFFMRASTHVYLSCYVTVMLKSRSKYASIMNYSIINPSI